MSIFNALIDKVRTEKMADQVDYKRLIDADTSYLKIVEYLELRDPTFRELKQVHEVWDSVKTFDGFLDLMRKMPRVPTGETRLNQVLRQVRLQAISKRHKEHFPDKKLPMKGML